MVTQRGDFAKALWPGINGWYGKAYSEYPVEYTDLFDTYKAGKAYTEDVGVSSFGLAAVKQETDGVLYDDESQAFVTRYPMITLGLGTIISREMYEDDQYQVVGPQKAAGLAFSMRQTKEIRGANVYNSAFDATKTGGDGVSLISDSHPNKAGGTWSNLLGTASDLTADAIEQACIDIAGFTNDAGLHIAIMPQCLIVPRQYVFIAERILKSTLQDSTADNAINAVRSTNVLPGGVKINHYLTDPDAWFIRTNAPHSMKYFERRPMEFSTDNDFNSENAKYKATERYAFGWTDPRGLYGSPGA